MRLRLRAALARSEDALVAEGYPPDVIGDSDEGQHAPVPTAGDEDRREADGLPAAGTGRLRSGLSSAFAPIAAFGAGSARLTGRATRLIDRLWLPGRTFAAVTQLPALLAVAWLLPGTGMLLAGRLLPLPMLIMFAPLALAMCYFAWRRLPASWPRFGAEAQPERRDVPLAAVLATVVIAAGFGLWQAMFASQQVLVAGDPGVYLQYGYWIAKHGTAAIPDSAAAFGAAGGLDFSSGGFFAANGSVHPGFLPGLPLVLAGGIWLAGVGGALLMPAVLGGCAVLSFGGLVGRLCGVRWAPAGALVLAVSLPEVYVSRTPLSEPLVQILLFGGLCMLLDSMVIRGRWAVGAVGGGTALAGLGGLALGLTVLANIGSLGLLLPAFPVLAALFVMRRPSAGPFGVGLFAGVGVGLAVGMVLARAYLSSLAAELHLFGLCAAGFGVLTALAAPLAFPAVRSWARRVLNARFRVLGLQGEETALPSLGTLAQWGAFVLPVLVLAGLVIRPYLQTVRGQTDDAVIRHVAGLQRLAGLPVDGRRQYYESSLDWVLWYLGVPAVLMAVAGAAVLGRRVTQAVLGWRSSNVAARLWVLPVLLVAWSVATILWDPAVLPWQPAATRRLVPLVLPGLLLLGLWVSTRISARAVLLGASRFTVGFVAFCCVLAMAVPAFWTTFNPQLVRTLSVGGYSSGVAKFLSRVQWRGIAASATYGGSLAAVNSLCTAIGSGASVVFVDAGTADELEPVVRGYCGQPAALVVPAGSAVSGELGGTGGGVSGFPGVSGSYRLTGGASAAAVERAVTAIERAGRRPVLLGATKTSLSLFGIVPRRVISLHTSGDAQVLTGPPAGNWPVSYTVWMAAPLGT